MATRYIYCDMLLYHAMALGWDRALLSMTAYRRLAALLLDATSSLVKCCIDMALRLLHPSHGSGKDGQQTIYLITTIDVFYRP